MTGLLIEPADLRQRLLRRFRNNHRQWFAGGGQWPLSLPLGVPTESRAESQLGAVRHWVEQWRQWEGEGELVWTERRWSRLGSQQLPERLLLHDPLQAAAWLGEQDRWCRASERRERLLGRWPQLSGGLARHFEVLADYPDHDYQRLLAVLAWFDANPQSGLYLRQLPIPGVHSKWIEQRKALLGALLQLVRGEEGSPDFQRVTGIREEPRLVRIRLLDQRLRERLGGLGDITAPVDQLAQLTLPVERVMIVENLRTGLAFDDLPGTVLFMGLGYAVDLFAMLPWARHLPCWYWGDLDTHGFAILNRLRHYLPHARSVLMDEPTLMEHLDLCTSEDKQADLPESCALNEQEARLYRQLIDGRWGRGVRLEQERIGWPYAWQRIQQIPSGGTVR